MRSAPTTLVTEHAHAPAPAATALSTATDGLVTLTRRAAVAIG